MADNNAPDTERGHSRIANGIGSRVEHNRVLQYPASVSIFSRMSREDPQIVSILSAVMLPILKAQWRVDPNGAADDVVAMVSNDLQLPVIGEDGAQPTSTRRGKVNWTEHLDKALSMLIFGHAYFEKVFEVRDDGRNHIKKLSFRPQETIQDIIVDDDGGLYSIVQRGYTTRDQKLVEPTEIPLDSLLGYTYKDRVQDWIGTSILRASYKAWVYKNELAELERSVLERNGMGIPVYTSSDDDDQDDIDFGQELVESLRAGDASGASIRFSSRLDIKGTNGQLPQIRPVIDAYNADIAKSVLAHALNLEGKGGSYALADVQMKLFIQSLETIAENIADTANQHLVEKMVYYYTGDADAVAPRIVFDEIGTNTHLTPGQISDLINSGAIQPDRPLEEHVRRQGGLPNKQLLEEVAHEMQEKRRLGIYSEPVDEKADTTPTSQSDNHRGDT